MMRATLRALAILTAAGIVAAIAGAAVS